MKKKKKKINSEFRSYSGKICCYFCVFSYDLFIKRNFSEKVVGNEMCERLKIKPDKVQKRELDGTHVLFIIQYSPRDLRI